MNNFSLWNRICHKLIYKLFGKGKVFIGDIDYFKTPIEIKKNIFGGENIKFKAKPGQFCYALTKDNRIAEDEITYLSIHKQIPLYEITYLDGSVLLSSPLNTVLVKDKNGWRTANLLNENIIGLMSPGYYKNNHINKVIVNVKDTGQIVDMYDVSLKKETMFLTGQNIFVYDTISLHVPVSPGAIRDVKNMMPSRNLVAEETGKLKSYPDHAAAAGLYLLSKTPKGRQRINDILPDKFNIVEATDKRQFIDILKKVVKSNPRTAGKIINDLRRLGDDHAYRTGFTLGISDIAPVKDLQHRAIKDIISKINRLPEDKRTSLNLENIYKDVSINTEKELAKYFEDRDNPLGIALLSKARGSASQIRDMILSPLAVASKKYLETPIKHSYAEGLDPAEYWEAARGARRGVMGRSQETAMPGALGKEVLATSNTLIVRGTHNNYMKSIDLPTKNTDDLLDRFVAKDIKIDGKTVIKKDTAINPHILQIAKRNKIKNISVYTPLGSSSADGSIPAYAYGLTKDGDIPEDGKNIGAISAFGLVEPLYQGSMASFHLGAAITGETSGYPRLKQILELSAASDPRKFLLNEATLSTETGQIKSITKDSLGGHNIVVNNKEFYVLPSNKLKIKIGDDVVKGDALSTGPIQPKDLANLKSLDIAQNYMVDEIRKNIPDIRRRAAETVVESITRHGIITDPGDTDYLPGDVDLINNIKDRNKDAKNNATYEFLMRGVNTLPQKTQSWLSKLNFRNLKRVFQKDFIEGATTDIHSFEPAPAMAYGIELGKGEKGKY